MNVLFRIVYRNLKEHRTKTLIIGIIVAVGMFFLIIGNSVIDTITAGISRNFVEYNTGHIAVFPSSIENPSLIGGPESIGDRQVVPTITNYKEVRGVVDSIDGVVAVSPQINGRATIQFADETTGFSQLLAVDPILYRDCFPENIEIIEGTFLEPGAEGIVLPVGALEMFGESMSESLNIGDPLILTTFGGVAGTKIREVPVVGIYDVTVATQAMTAYVDVVNMRALLGMTQITDIEVQLTEAEQDGLGMVDEDDLFGDGVMVSAVDSGNVSAVPGPGESAPSTTTHEPDNVPPSDAWHYLLVRLDDGGSIRRSVAVMNEAFAAAGLEVTAYSWLDAAGQVAQMTDSLRLIFNIIIFVIAVVATIIIMNTLVISVTERIGEIGTMRAIGAQKSFVRRMVILETLFIGLVFGGIGALLGATTIGVISLAGIETGNLIVQMLAGGPVIRPIITASSALTSFLGMIVAGVIASYYPAVLALRIEPRQAMAGN